MNFPFSFPRALVSLLLLSYGLLAQAQSMEKQTLLGFDELKKLTDVNQLGSLLDYIVQHPSSKWPKIYSAEYCDQKLKGKEQAEAVQIRKLAEQVVGGLDLYQAKLGTLPQDEFVKSMNNLFNLRDALDQPAYGNIVLEVAIDRIATLWIAERVVTHNDDLKALNELVKRKRDWFEEWRPICQMIEEEEGKKIFDYEGMEKVSPGEVFDGRKAFENMSEKEQMELLKNPAGKRNPKWLGGAFNPEDMKTFLSTLEMLREKDFNGLLYVIEVHENIEGKMYLPALIEFKKRGGDFNRLDEKWEDRFDNLMSDYMGRPEVGNWDGYLIKGFVEGVKEIGSGAKIPGFNLTIKWP